MEKDLWELERLRRYATELQGLIGEAESVAPERAEGADRTNAIRMAIGPDAMPETIRVAVDWQRKLDPEAVGAAVLEAYAACVQRRMADWTQIMEHRGLADRMRRLDELQAETDAPIPGAPGDSLPAAFRPDVGHIEARPTDLIAEDVLSAADSAIAATARTSTPQVRGAGSTRRREVTITLSPAGLVACEVDPAWAARQTAVRLTEALRTALAQARENFAAGKHAWSGDGSRLGDLLSEMFAATFNDPRIRPDR